MSDLDFLDRYKTEETDKKKVMRAPFGWVGGKMYTAKFIAETMPVKKRYIECFGGSGVVLLNRQRSKVEVFNDRNSGISDFYITLIEDHQWLIDYLNSLVYSKAMFYRYKDKWKELGTRRMRAVMWYYIIRCSWGGKGQYFGVEVHRNQSRVLWNNLKLFPEIQSRMKMVVVENADYYELFKEYNDKDSVFYCDPPYINCEDSGYGYDIDHALFLKRVFDCRGYISVSNYDSELYNKCDWDNVIEIKQRMNMRQDSSDTGRLHRMEYLYIKEAR